MYIIVTYGTQGWRGVQERGIAIANELGKNRVLFWNGYDSEFIRSKGFKVKTVNTSLIDPDDIKIPKNTKAVIFADLPTNELFNFSLFFAAKEKNIPIVIFDQIYRRGQTKEMVYQTFAQNSDLLLLNGLDLFKEEEKDNFKIIPPLAPYKKEIDKSFLRRKLAYRYNINEDKKWLFIAGYYQPVFEMVQKVMSDNELLQQCHFIISSAPLENKAEKKKKSSDNNPIYLPYISQQQHLRWMNACDIFISKFGYLQLIEAIALKTPIIIAGKAGLVLTKDILDKRLQKAIYYANDHKELKKYIIRLLQRPYLTKWSNLANKLHRSNQFNGAKIAAKYIIELKKKVKNAKQIKTLVVALVNETSLLKKVLEKEKYCYPIIIAAPISQPVSSVSPVKRMPEQINNITIRDILEAQTTEILPHDFKEVVILSPRKYDGLVNIMPWYSIWLKNLKHLFKKADKIFITETANNLLQNFIKPFITKTVQIKL